MTEHDPIDIQLEHLLAQESMPADAIVQTLARVELARLREHPAPSPEVTRTHKRLTRRRFVQLMAACLAAGTLGAGGFAYAAETGQIELDGDASLELGVNRWDRVVRVETQDASFAPIVDALDLMGCSCAEALNRLVSSPDALQGLSGENGVALVVVCAHTAQQRTLFTECEAAAAAFGNGSFCTEATSETRQSAHLAGMGVARYEMYLRIAALDPSVTLDECRDLPMCTLRSMLASLEDTDSDSVLSTGCVPGKGNGHGMGGWRRSQR